MTASTKQSPCIAPAREKSNSHSKTRTSRKRTASCIISRLLNPFFRHSMVKIAVILCIITVFTASLPTRSAPLNPAPNAPKCLTSESNINKGLNSAEMSVDLPISTNASKSKGSTSHDSPPPCSDQGEGSGNKTRAHTAESVSPKSSLQQLKKDLQTNRIITNLSRGQALPSLTLQMKTHIHVVLAKEMLTPQLMMLTSHLTWKL